MVSGLTLASLTRFWLVFVSGVGWSPISFLCAWLPSVPRNVYFTLLIKCTKVTLGMTLCEFQVHSVTI